MSPVVRVVLPVRTWSEANLRVHWSRRASRAATQRGLARLLVGRTLRLHDVETAGALEITLVRIAPCRLDDDNLAVACKAVRDGIADALGVDDGDERLTWTCGQRKGAVREYAVEVTIQSLAAACTRCGGTGRDPEHEGPCGVCWWGESSAADEARP